MVRVLSAAQQIPLERIYCRSVSYAPGRFLNGSMLLTLYHNFAPNLRGHPAGPPGHLRYDEQLGTHVPMLRGMDRLLELDVGLA